MSKNISLVVAMDFIGKDFHRINMRTGIKREDFDMITGRFLMKYPIVEGMAYDEFRIKYRNVEQECREHCLE